MDFLQKDAFTPGNVNLNPAPILTIAIPTYGRNELLLKNTALLFAQLRPAVRILIVDNASPTPVSETLGALPAGVTLVRNRVNVGGNENILRCLEMCETPWAMVTGDDDAALPDMIERILMDISANPDATLLHYATANMHRREGAWQTRGRTEFLSRVDSFDNLLFISSSVFHVARLRTAFDWAHHHTYSCAPHLVLLLKAMGQDALAIFRPESLVDWRLPDVENRGSKFAMALGLPTILELPLTGRERAILAGHLARFNSAGELMHEALLAALYGGRSRREAFDLYIHALHRLPLRFAILRRFWGWYLAPLLLVPSLGYAIVGRFAQAVIGRAMGPENLRSNQL